MTIATVSGRRLGGAALAAFLLAGTAPAVPAAASPTGNYLAGRFAEHQDDWRAAAGFMTEALAASPAEPTLLRRTMLLKIGEGQIDAAVPLARRVMDQGGDVALAALTLAVDHLAHGRNDEAKAAAARIPLEGVGRIAGSLVTAWIEVARGDTDGALTRLAPLGAVQGMKALYDLHAALILDIGGRTEQAGRHYAAITNAEAPLRVVQVAGNFLERTGQPEKARTLYAALGERASENVTVEPLLKAAAGKPAAVIPGAREGLAEALFDLGSALHNEGAADHSLLYGRTALYLRPDLTLARLLVADILAERKHANEALAEYKTLEADPLLTRMARLRAAETYADTDRTEEAIALLRTIADERQDHSRALIRLGDLYRSIKRWDEAIAAYDEVVKRLGEPEERDWPVYYARGIAYERTNRWAEAEADFKTALTLRPQEAFVLNYLGYSWVDRGLNLTEAKGMIEQAVALRPRDGYIVDSLGWALYRMGDFDEAVVQLERAVELKPADATINDHLGDAYWRVGRRNEARFQWQRALKAADEDDLKGQIEAKLEKGLVDPKTAGSTSK